MLCCFSAPLCSSTNYWTLFNKGITKEKINTFTALSNTKNSQTYFNLNQTEKKQVCLLLIYLS